MNRLQFTCRILVTFEDAITKETYQVCAFHSFTTPTLVSSNEVEFLFVRFTKGGILARHMIRMMKANLLVKDAIDLRCDRPASAASIIFFRDLQICPHNLGRFDEQSCNYPVPQKPHVIVRTTGLTSKGIA